MHGRSHMHLLVHTFQHFPARAALTQRQRTPPPDDMSVKISIRNQEFIEKQQSLLRTMPFGDRCRNQYGTRTLCSVFSSEFSISQFNWGLHWSKWRVVIV